MKGCWRLRQIEGIKPFKSDDPEYESSSTKAACIRTSPSPFTPDPVSGMHCWHQRVRVERAESDDKCGDVVVDTKASHDVHRKRLEMTGPAPGPGACVAHYGSRAQ
jgi:hypothetical protein